MKKIQFPNDQKLNLVFLPATDPEDRTYGTIPERIDGFQDVSVYPLHFPTMVWYNEAVRRQAIKQIDSLCVSLVVLVGFSKSGLGAWNIARAIPDRTSATIIFDAPVAREGPPPLGSTSPFYASAAAWLEDLPIRRVKDFKAAVSATHRLVLISGENFHDEMTRLSHTLDDAGIAHVFLPRPQLKHHWQSGWIEEGLNILLRQQLAPDAHSLRR